MRLKVVGADLWLSNTLADIEDGFLSVVRLNGEEFLAYGTLQEPKIIEEAPVSKRKSVVIKTFRSIQVKLDQKEPTKIELSNTKNSNLNVEISIFMLVQKDPKANNKQMDQSIHFISNGIFRMTEKDLEIATSTTTATEVGASATLEENAGEIKVLFSLGAPTQEDAQKSTSQSEGFSIHFTSAEALEKDLQLKARQKAEEEIKLLTRLRRIETFGVKLRDQRRLEIQRFRLVRAARLIQKGFRLHLERKKKERKQREAEEKERLEARKAEVKQRVKERNQKRTRAMVNQIKSFTSPVPSPSKPLMQLPSLPPPLDTKQEQVPFSMESFIKQREQEELEKLQSKLSLLKQQKDQLLNKIQLQEDDDKKIKSSTRKKQDKEEAKPIDQDLIQAIQQVYFRK